MSDTAAVAPTRNGGAQGRLTEALSLLAALLPGLYLLVTSTTTLVTTFALYDFKRMLEFLLLFALFLLPVFSRDVRLELVGLLARVPTWIKTSTFILFAWGILSALINTRLLMQLANSLSEVVLLAALTMAVFVIAACRRISAKAFDRIAITLISLTGLSVGIQEIMGVLVALSSETDFGYAESFLHFAHPRFYNQFQTWTIPALATVPIIFPRNRSALLLCVFALGLQWYMVLMTGARGSFLSLTIAMVAGALILPFCRKPILQCQVAGIVLGLLIYSLVLVTFETQGQPATAAAHESRPNATRQVTDGGYYGNEDGTSSAFLAQSLGRPMTSSTGRFTMWNAVIDDVKQRPIFGIGPMHYACTDRVWFGHPHNFPLQVAAEWGLPASFLTIGLIIAVLFRTVSRVRQCSMGSGYHASMASIILISVIAASLHSLLSGLPIMPVSQVSGVLLCGLLLGAMSKNGAQPKPSGTWWLSIMGLSLSVALIGFGTNEVRTMEPRTATLGGKPRVLAPRMWQDSKVCVLYGEQRKVSN